MEFVGIEKQLFEELVRKFEYFEHRVMEICNRENDRTLHKWMDNQDVCRYLNISPRTLQTLRDNGTLPFSQNQSQDILQAGGCAGYRQES